MSNLSNVKFTDFEPTLFLVRLAQNQLETSKARLDLTAQLAYLRLEKAAEALQGKVSMAEFERKLISGEKTHNCQEVWVQRSVVCELPYGHEDKHKNGPYSWESSQ